jgi:3',5'-cyclic AMP phosphodiesterase CpdA
LLYRLKPQVALPELDLLLITGDVTCDDSKHNYYPMKQLIAPQGKICSIVQTKAPVDMGDTLRQKNATFVWELMFTRSLFQTYDTIAQHHLLNTVADLIDRKKIKKPLKVLQ